MFSYRYPDTFVDRDQIREMQNELQILINHSLLSNMTGLTGALPSVDWKTLSVKKALSSSHNQLLNRLVKKNAGQNKSKHHIIGRQGRY